MRLSWQRSASAVARAFLQNGGRCVVDDASDASGAPTAISWRPCHDEVGAGFLGATAPPGS